MERKSQGTEVSETPVANTVLCITLSDFPWELGEAWDLAPSLRHSGEHVHFGMYFTASKGFPETLHWVFIPWQTGLAVGAACLLLVWWRLNSPGPNGDSFGNRSAALNPSYLCSERMN